MNDSDIKNTDTIYHKFQYLLIAIIAFLLAFNAVLQVFFKYKLDFSFFSYLKEILIIALVLLNISLILRQGLNKYWQKIKSNRLLIGLVLIYLVYILSSILWVNTELTNSLIYGFKYDGFLFIALLAGLTLNLEAEEQVDKTIKIFWVFSLLAVLTGLIIHFVITPENLTILGYRNDWSTFYADQALAFCQKIEHSKICRFQGTFSGPNQASANLLLLFVSGVFLAKIKKGQKNWYYWIANAVAAVALYLTFSRSAWIAFIILIALIVLNLKTKNIKKIILASVLGLTAIIASTLAFIPEVVLRYGSNSDRVKALLEGVQVFKEQALFGLGIGQSGPASHYLANPLITENWFLQVAINYGLVGLFLFVAIYFLLIKKLYLNANKYRIFAYLMIAVLVPLNLLHYFEDSSWTYSLFIIIGAIIALPNPITYQGQNQ